MPHLAVRSSRAVRIATFALLCSGLGCSALVSPDTTRLGGGGGNDGSVVRFDGAGIDAGPRADTGPQPDSGPRPDGAVFDGGPGCPATCDDGIACTLDECVGTACMHTPNDALCSNGQRCNPATGCGPSTCRSDADCDNNTFCDGTERCAPGTAGANTFGCVAGARPSCESDGVGCTVDACDEATRRCTNRPDDTRCDDGFACTADRCDAMRDCVRTPNNAMCSSNICTVGAMCAPTMPGANMLGCVGGQANDCLDGNACTTDSCDPMANACVHPARDGDGDGFPAARVNGPNGTTLPCTGGTDCNDGNRAINPSATEVCANMVDDNCNGTVDENCARLPDTCATAQEITLTGGVGSATGSFAGLQSNYSTVCGGQNTRDAVYYVDISDLSDVTIDTVNAADPTDGTDTILGVGVVTALVATPLPACDGNTFQSACDDDLALSPQGMSRPQSVKSRVWVHRVGGLPGRRTRIYILVDSYARDATGSYVVNVRVRSAAADSCNATPIDITGGGTLLGYIGGSSGQSGSCSMSNFAAEGVATFTASTGSVRFDAFSRQFVPEVYLRREPCGTGTEVACVRGAGATGGTNTARLPPDPTPGQAVLPGRHFVFVDGYSGIGVIDPPSYTLSYEPNAGRM